MKSNYRKKEKPPIKLRISFILLFAFTAFSCCFVMYMKDNGTVLTEPLVKVIFPDRSGDDHERPDTSAVNPLASRTALPQTYFSECLFVGNSAARDLTPAGAEKIVFGEDTDSLYLSKIQTDRGRLYVSELTNASEKKNIYLLFSAETIHLSAETTADNVGRFIDKIYSFDKNIYIISPLPCLGENNVNDPFIDQLGRQLLQTANEKGVYYIDCASLMKKPDGHIYSNFIDNGTLNPYGRRALTNTLLTRYADDQLTIYN